MLNNLKSHDYVSWFDKVKSVPCRQIRMVKTDIRVRIASMREPRVRRIVPGHVLELASQVSRHKPTPAAKIENARPTVGTFQYRLQYR